MKLIPALIEKNLSQVETKLTRIKGKLKRVQVDFLDGRFADNQTVSLQELTKSKLLTDFSCDFHLMVKQPLEYLSAVKYLPAGCFIPHLQQLNDQQEFLDFVQQNNLQAGLALDLHTPVQAVDQQILKNLQIILLLSVQAGFGGQQFSETVFPKIEHFSYLKKKEGCSYEICVDGGIDLKRARQCFDKGADDVAVGSYFWQSKDTQACIKKFTEIGKNE